MRQTFLIYFILFYFMFWFCLCLLTCCEKVLFQENNGMNEQMIKKITDFITKGEIISINVNKFKTLNRH